MAENKENLVGLGTNYTAANSWFAYLPLENILGKNYKNLDLHLKRFSLPQIEMGSMSVPYKGYSKEMPTKVLNSGPKELTLTYIVDDKWLNYKSLYAWISCPEGTLNPIVQAEGRGVQPTDYIPLSIYCLDNYKKQIVQFVFENCWIKYFADLTLEASNPAELEHSFCFSYDQFHIEDV